MTHAERSRLTNPERGSTRCPRRAHGSPADRTLGGRDAVARTIAARGDLKCRLSPAARHVPGTALRDAAPRDLIPLPDDGVPGDVSRITTSACFACRR